MENQKPYSVEKIEAYFRDSFSDESKRKINNRVKREVIRWEEAINQKPVSQIGVVVKWKRSRVWGHNPHLSASISFADGTRTTFSTSCYGCGYDKLSTVFSQLCDRFLVYLLAKKIEAGCVEPSSKPYGVYYDSDGAFVPSFSGGIGMSCYTDNSYNGGIIQWLGGSCTCVYSDNDTDAYKITF